MQLLAKRLLIKDVTLLESIVYSNFIVVLVYVTRSVGGKGRIHGSELDPSRSA
jgi:hypothetical protein